MGNPSLAFLHTSPVHVASFDALLADLAPGAISHHVVDEALLADAREQGLTTEIVDRVTSRMNEAGASGAAVVVCTCSTIGGIAEDRDGDFSFAAHRVDRAMADAAVRGGSNILVVAALASTLDPTRDLVMTSAESLGREVNINMHHIVEAWRHFEAGDNDQYWQAIAEGIRANAIGHDVVVIAQASMAGAANLCADMSIPILSSPRLGVERALAAVSSS